MDLVYARLDEATRSARQVARAGRSLFQSDRGSYVREEDGTGLYERDVFAFQAAKRLAVLDAEHEGLVFGRLDRTDGEIRYIGRIGVRDADYEPLVIDWRAPAAEPFYRATPANPMQVVRRRVLRCQGDRVIGIEDDLLDGDADSTELVVIGEGALMAALSRARGHTMRDIVATIQAEQDEAIRAPYQGFTMISGGPGTGKTVVALHRAAYLLYSNRRRFESGGVLVVGPSRVFMNYIERVLPSLGEDAVTLRSIGSVASDVVRIERRPGRSGAGVGDQGQPADDQGAAPPGQRAAEGGAARAAVDHAGRRPRGAPGDPAADRAPTCWPTTSSTSVARRPRRPCSPRCGGSGRRSLDVERDEFDDQISDLAAFVMFLHAWWPVTSATTALSRLGRSGPDAAGVGSVLSNAECDAVSASYRAMRAGRVRADWTAADGALLDELVHLLGPMPAVEEVDPTLFLEEGSDYAEVVTTADRLRPQREVDPFELPHQTYAHILVDEAQDITPDAVADAATARRPAPAGPSSATRPRARGRSRRGGAAGDQRDRSAPRRSGGSG